MLFRLRWLYSLGMCAKNVADDIRYLLTLLNNLKSSLLAFGFLPHNFWEAADWIWCADNIG